MRNCITLHNKQGSEIPKSFGFGILLGEAMTKSNRHIKGLGEVSFRVRDLDAMHKFYDDVIGLEVAAHRGLCQAGREFCFLQNRLELGIWRAI